MSPEHYTNIVSHSDMYSIYIQCGPSWRVPISAKQLDEPHTCFFDKHSVFQSEARICSSFHKVSLELCLNCSYFKVWLPSWWIWTYSLVLNKRLFIYFNIPIFKIFTYFRNYGYLKFGCCILAGQNAIIRDRNEYA